MKALLIALAGFFCVNFALAETVRVRIKKNTPRLSIEGLGIRVGLQPQNVLPVGLPQVERFDVKLSYDKNRWPIWHLKGAGQKKATRLVGSALHVEAQSLRVGLTPVPNTLELLAAPDGHVDVIATLDLEKYLTGVLPSEMPASWPMEALKAQVIASRSYALSIMRERRSQSFQLESSVMDQVFDLQNHTGATDFIRDKVARAVRETAGQVLLDDKGRVLKAHYHADCGGRTESSRLVWGEEVFESGVTKDALCPLSPLARWQHRLSKFELREALAPYFGVGPGIALESIVLMGRTMSGRVANVDVIFSDRQKRKMSSHEFRKALGFQLLKSTNFAFFWQGDLLVIEGRGHGHGVGMCQYGARQLALRGLNYREIVANYYPNAVLGVSRSKEALL